MVTAQFRTILKWYRFLDDTFAALSDKRDVDNILSYLNNFDPSLAFTVEHETVREGGKETSLTFLDIEINRREKNCYSRHFVKQSQSDRTL